MLSCKGSKFEMSGEKFDYSELTDKRWNEMRQLMDSTNDASTNDESSYNAVEDSIQKQAQKSADASLKSNLQV